MSSGDTAWILISAALVMLRTPGLALFYAGMVRKKNVLSTMMMSFAILAVIGVLWVLYGYTLAFGPDKGGFIGGLDWIGLRNGMFAIITVALMTGAIVERMKFSAVLTFSVLWFTLIYCPVAHWVWGSGGWLAKLGALDFAGGTVVHITAGVSAMALALVLGPRRGFAEKHPMEPANIPMVALGAALLWFGWFGFNAGSALTSGGLAANAFVTTNTAACSAAITWMSLGWIHRRPSLLGVATGAVVGLVAITPGAGFVSPLAAIPIGMVAAAISFYVMMWRTRQKVDESLDVWACHGMGGTWGALATGIFASAAVNAAGTDGLIYGSGILLAKQAAAVGVVWVVAFVGTWVIAKAVNAAIGLRVKQEEEVVGLDISQHGERAYGGL